MTFRHQTYSLLVFWLLVCVLHAQSGLDTEDAPIIFISDTQSPLWFEELYLDYNQNENARAIIFDDIIKQRPAAIVHLGDLVGLGYKQSHWETIDNFSQQLGQAGIAFFPTLGNHELFTFPVDGEKNFMTRFPFYLRTGYTRRIGRTAVILLNSNFEQLSDFYLRKQQQWFENELKLLNNDTTIAHIIVGCHHSPFTNSSMVAASEEVQQNFVSIFIQYTKCRLFISGHAHRFEHFQFFDKDFIVTGGGGGMQHPAIEDPEKLYQDKYKAETDLCPFHYVQVFPGVSLKVVARMLSTDQSRIEEGYSVSIENEIHNLASGRIPGQKNLPNH